MPNEAELILITWRNSSLQLLISGYWWQNCKLEGIHATKNLSPMVKKLWEQTFFSSLNGLISFIHHSAPLMAWSTSCWFIIAASNSKADQAKIKRWTKAKLQRHTVIFKLERDGNVEHWPISFLGLFLPAIFQEERMHELQAKYRWKYKSRKIEYEHWLGVQNCWKNNPNLV